MDADTESVPTTARAYPLRSLNECEERRFIIAEYFMCKKPATGDGSRFLMKVKSSSGTGDRLFCHMGHAIDQYLFADNRTDIDARMFHIDKPDIVWRKGIETFFERTAYLGYANVVEPVVVTDRWAFDRVKNHFDTVLQGNKVNTDGEWVDTFDIFEHVRRDLVGKFERLTVSGKTLEQVSDGNGKHTFVILFGHGEFS